MNILELDGQLLAVLSVGALIFFVLVWVGLGVTRAREDMTNRLALYGRATGGVIRDDELAKPLAQRTIGPIVLKISNFLNRFTPTGYLEKTQHNLVLAGNPGNLDAPSFVVIKLLTTALGLFAAFFLVDYGSSQLPADRSLRPARSCSGSLAPPPGCSARSMTGRTPCCWPCRTSWTCW